MHPPSIRLLTLGTCGSFSARAGGSASSFWFIFVPVEELEEDMAREESKGNTQESLQVRIVPILQVLVLAEGNLQPLRTTGQRKLPR